MTLSPTDWDLILGCRDGQAGAWEQLVSRYERLIYSITLSYRLPREDAADVAQTAFLSLFRSIGSLHEETRLSAWLATVAHRQARRLIHSRRHEHPDALDLLDDLAPSIGPPGSSPMERWELVEWLDYGMAALNERCRRLLLALYFDPAEPSYAEIAAAFGLPAGSIGPNRARCLAQLRAALQNREL
ncbi:MAG: sigma-70 family RNA polymerase sigma factor [Chloroflexales bacterium]